MKFLRFGAKFLGYLMMSVGVLTTALVGYVVVGVRFCENLPL